MRRKFFIIFTVLFAVIGGVYTLWPPVLWALVLVLPLFLIGVSDVLQKRQAIRRNFPVLGNLRYLFEMVRPELQQYFVESDLSGRPISRELRSVVYQRAKGQLQTRPFGTQRDVYAENHEWVQHSMTPQHVENEDRRVEIGGPDCKKPYSASLLNISAMSYGSLSKTAIESLNLGAKKGGFFHNTGEGGISPFHRKGGDLCWQIGTGYFGCRNTDGTFSDEKFQEKAQWDEVKLIEIKVSQGAKPGKGGILPGSKVTEEIAEIRGCLPGQDVISPAGHSAFTGPSEMLEFIKKLRDLSGGKPVGIKICLGRKSEFIDFCKTMVEKKIYPDFITVDGAEGGTGAAPLEFANSVGTPLEEGLVFVNDVLVGFGLRKYIRLIATGRVFTSIHIITKLALGADVVNSGRGMMLALGCIQALQCNANTCPAGVATTDPGLYKGVHVPTKADRVWRYHKDTMHSLMEIIGAMGYTSPQQVTRSDIFRRHANSKVATYEEIWPTMQNEALLSEHGLQNYIH